MHIEESTDGPGTRHRHFLALPLLLLALISIGGDRSGSKRAELIPVAATGDIRAVGGDTSFTLARGIAGLLREDGRMHDDGEMLTLEEGTVLFRSQGLNRIAVEDVRLAAFRGGVLVSKNGTKLSVHALTSPVLMRRGTFAFVIPVGMQGTWKTEALPDAFSLDAALSERLRLSMIESGIARHEHEELAQLAPPIMPAFSGQSSLSSMLEPFMLPVSRNRIEGTHRQTLLSDFRSALSGGDLSALRRALNNADLQQYLLSAEVPVRTLETLLAESADLPGIAQEVAQYLTDTDLWLLLSFHPSYHAAAWESLGSFSVYDEAEALRLLLLPSSDVSEAIPERAINRWQAQVILTLRTMKDPDAFLRLLLTSIREYPAFAEKNGYPQRLIRYAAALQGIAEPFLGQLSPETQELLQPWKTVNAIAPYVEAAPLPIVEEVTSSSSSSSSSLVVEIPFDADATVAQAKKILLESGALFTTQTTLEAESASAVQVRNLLFADKEGEHVYEFLLDPITKQAKSIHRDGELSPYALSLEALAKWAINGR